MMPFILGIQTLSTLHNTVVKLASIINIMLYYNYFIIELRHFDEPGTYQMSENKPVERWY